MKPAAEPSKSTTNNRISTPTPSANEKLHFNNINNVPDFWNVSGCLCNTHSGDNRMCQKHAFNPNWEKYDDNDITSAVKIGGPALAKGEKSNDLTSNDGGFDDGNRNNTPAAEFARSEEGTPAAAFARSEEGKELESENSDNLSDDGDETSLYVPNANKELDFSDDEDFLLQLSDCSDDLIANNPCEKNKRAASPQKKGQGYKRFDKGSQPPYYSNMSEDEAILAKEEFAKERKRWTDAERSKRIKAGGILTGITFTGVSIRQSPLEVGRTFANKDVLSLRIAEEVNLRIITVATNRSDECRLEVFGDGFTVVSAFSESKGWAVTTCKMGNESRTQFTGKMKPRSPFMAVWLAALIRGTIEETPKVPNKLLKDQLQAYGCPYAITEAIVQQAKTKARTMIFGSPEENVKYAYAVVHECHSLGHHFSVEYSDRKGIMKRITAVVINFEQRRLCKEEKKGS